MFRLPIASPGNDQIRLHFLSLKNRIVQATRLARNRIWISAFVINCNLNRAGDPVTLLLSLLTRKTKQGVDVRILCDDPALNRPNYHCNKFIMRWLEEWQIPYCTPPKKITVHAKCFLVDSTALFIGSHNLTKSSLDNPLECTVEILSPGIIAEFAAAFEVIWHDSAMITHMPPFTHTAHEPRPWMEHKRG